MGGAGAVLVVDGFATAVGVLQRAVRPGTWRRPVRAEFRRVLEVAGPGCLGLVVAVAGLVGLALVAQALYWLDRVGEDVDIDTVIAQVVIREIAVLATALLLIGRAGLRLLSELIELQRRGGVRQLDRQGVDPFLLLIVPRVLALPLALFCHAVLFIAVAFVVGFFAASAAGAVSESVQAFGARALGSLGEYGALVLPVKALASGFAIGVALCVTGLAESRDGAGEARRLSRGFGHMLLATLLVNLLLSLAL